MAIHEERAALAAQHQPLSGQTTVAVEPVHAPDSQAAPIVPDTSTEAARLLPEHVPEDHAGHEEHSTENALLLAAQHGSEHADSLQKDHKLKHVSASALHAALRLQR